MQTPERRVTSFVDGWEERLDGPSVAIRDPADMRQLVAVAEKGNRELLDAALAAAECAAPEWAATPAPVRGELLEDAARRLAENAEDSARTMTREMGKVLAESHAEVQRAVDVLRFFAQAPRVQAGVTAPLRDARESAFTLRVPLGVVGVITPWNFPLAIPAWKIAAALAFGNVVVFKPAELAPMSAAGLVRCLVDAGLPDGALSMVLGPGSELGPALVDAPATAGVSFTGSTAVGQAIARRAADSQTRVQCEMGGRNAIVVLADADLEAAVETVLVAGFGTTGQRCTSSSRVIVERAVAAAFTERLVAAAKQLPVGPGLDPRNVVGPLVGPRQLDDVLASLTRAIAEGGEILHGGRRMTEGELAYGNFMEPTVVRVPPDSWFSRHEVFGPVVAVFDADDYDHALRLNNAVPYGLSSAIFTRSLEHAMRFVHEADTGMVHVNRPTVGAEPHIPFGGAKASSIGPPEMAGAWQFYTASRVAHVRWGSDGS